MSITPNLIYNDRTDNSNRPSWSNSSVDLESLFRRIYAETKHLEGWQEEGDAYKLVEMGFHAGDTILEVGTFAGRSSVLMLKAALSNPDRKDPPQFFGIDNDIRAVLKTLSTLRENGLDKYAVVVPGDIKNFFGIIKATPSMVFVDGDHSYQGCRTDLQALSESLSSGTPVLLHDWAPGTEDCGVGKASSEWQAEGCASFAGLFGCSGLYVTTAKCAKPKFRYSLQDFETLQRSFLKLVIDTCKQAGIA